MTTQAYLARSQVYDMYQLEERYGMFAWLSNR
eukprot:CAMPEP_0170743724 /NCGR_PEP_ID=MMETSP0437-20130122/7414_1 /TAXON_ID=0 /ORGANISM="Sexangularia sp." /LENGTH=31 /DNA_ID= /DNA_START= /DNA_END= /DNA_ORIENTATION=